MNVWSGRWGEKRAEVKWSNAFVFSCLNVRILSGKSKRRRENENVYMLIYAWMFFLLKEFNIYEVFSICYIYRSQFLFACKNNKFLGVHSQTYKDKVTWKHQKLPNPLTSFHIKTSIRNYVGVSSYSKVSFDAHAPATDTATEPHTATRLHARVGSLRSHHPWCDRARLGPGKTPTVHPCPSLWEAVGDSLAHGATRVRGVTDSSQFEHVSNSK